MLVPVSKKPPKKKIYNGLRAPINGVILHQMHNGPTFRGCLLRNITNKNEGFFLAIYRIFTIVKVRTTDF